MAAPVPGNPTPASDLCRHQASTKHTYFHSGKIFIHMKETPALGRQRQGDLWELEASMVYKGNAGQPGLHRETKQPPLLQLSVSLSGPHREPASCLAGTLARTQSSAHFTPATVTHLLLLGSRFCCCYCWVVGGIFGDRVSQCFPSYPRSLCRLG